MQQVFDEQATPPDLVLMHIYTNMPCLVHVYWCRVDSHTQIMQDNSSKKGEIITHLSLHLFPTFPEVEIGKSPVTTGIAM